MIKSIFDHNTIITYENDLVNLSSRVPPNSKNYERIMSIISTLREIDLSQTTCSKGLSSDETSPKKISHDWHDQLYTLLTENQFSSTWLTEIVDRYCENDDEQKLRLYNFTQKLLGPVIKLFKVIRNNKITLAIEFPDQEMCDIFLKQTGMTDMQPVYTQENNEIMGSIVVDNKTVFVPAFLSENQQLAVMFPTIKMRDNAIHILNLDKANLIMSNLNANFLQINDRRIHDTAAKFHLTVICPYFIEYYRTQYIARTIDQGRRSNGLFSQSYLPRELALKIVVASSNLMDIDAKMQIANLNLKS